MQHARPGCVGWCVSLVIIQPISSLLHAVVGRSNYLTFRVRGPGFRPAFNTITPRTARRKQSTRISMPDVKIVEVGPRDGLQNIQQVIPTELKVQLIQRLATTGLSTIEATSFVSPKWIPQLADGRAVLQKIKPLMQNSTMKYPVLVPNVTGLDAAIDAGAKEVAVFVSATEGFSRKNTNCTIAESLDRVRAVANRAKSIGIPVRGYVGMRL